MTKYKILLCHNQVLKKMSIYSFYVFVISVIIIGSSFSQNTEKTFLTKLESEVFEEINLIRTNPKMYSEILNERKKYYKDKMILFPDKIPIRTVEGVKALDEAILFLKNSVSTEKFLLSKGLSNAAKYHVDDMGKNGLTGHISSNGGNINDRISRYGTWDGCCGENIDYGNNIAREIIINLIIDDGIKNRGHRKNIFSNEYKYIGISCGKHKKYKFSCVLDFACSFEEK